MENGYLLLINKEIEIGNSRMGYIGRTTHSTEITQVPEKSEPRAMRIINKIIKRAKSDSNRRMDFVIYKKIKEGDNC